MYRKLNIILTDVSTVKNVINIKDISKRPLGGDTLCRIIEGRSHTKITGESQRKNILPDLVNNYIVTLDTIC